MGYIVKKLTWQLLDDEHFESLWYLSDKELKFLRFEVDFTCQICGIKKEKRSSTKKGKIWKLHVHHLDGNRANNIKTNLMVLCSRCHKKIHYRKPLGLSIKNKGRIRIMKNLRSQGLSYRKIGLKFNLTRQRIHQLIACG